MCQLTIGFSASPSLPPFLPSSSPIPLSSLSLSSSAPSSPSSGCVDYHGGQNYVRTGRSQINHSVFNDF